jgi:PAS domain S-box-containing protein
MKDTLGSLSRFLSKDFKIKENLIGSLQIICRTRNADKGILCLLNKSTAATRIRITDGFPHDKRLAFPKTCIDCARLGSPVCFQGAAPHNLLKCLGGTMAEYHHLVTPLDLGEHLTGLIVLFREKTRKPFTKADATFVTKFGVIMKFVLNNTFLFLKAQEEQEELARSRDFIDNILSSLPQGLFVVSLHGTVIYWNENMAHRFNYPAKRAKGKQYREILDQIDLNILEALIEDVMKRNERIVIERYEYRTAEGTRHVCKIEAQPNLDLDERPAGVLVSIEDISEQAVLEEELRRTYSRINETINELRAKTRQLELANVELSRADKLKSEFLSNMSHELRTPLNSILNLTQMLLQGLPGELNTRQRNYLAIVERNGRHLLNLINDILDLSKIEAGKSEVVSAHFNIKALIGQIVSIFSPQAMQKKIRISTSYDLTRPDVFTDESKVKQIVLNLVSNAVKFTEVGQVEVLVRDIPFAEVKERTARDPFLLKLHLFPERQYVEIVVKDSGPGIKDEFLPFLFRPFRQADGSITRKFGGTGLGLHITHRLLEMLKGGASVYSKEGEGTTFSVLLPVSSGTQKTQRKKEADPDEEMRIDLSGVNLAEALQGKSIVIIEDNLDNLFTLTEFLSAHDLDFSTATDGEEGLRLIEDERPDLVLLDIQIPEVSGYDVAARVRANPELAGTKILAITAHSMLGDRERILSSGCHDYIAKPMDFNMLLTKMYNLISGHGA